MSFGRLGGCPVTFLQPLKNIDILPLCHSKAYRTGKKNRFSGILRYRRFREGGLKEMSKGRFSGKDQFVSLPSTLINVDSCGNKGKSFTTDERIRIIIAYGPQENELKKEREQFYDDLNVEIERAKLNEELILIAGEPIKR